MFNANGPILPQSVIPIIVGAHLRAEVGDRPLAEQVKGAIEAWKATNDVSVSPYPLVCTDMWYLNSVELRIQPSLSIGSPEVNAATAAFASDIPTLVEVPDAYRIQADPTFIDLKCSLWGIDTQQTQLGIDAFVKDVMGQWLGAFFGISVEN
ncbi:MAG: hypothetical protein VX615_04475 [Planctomycetota bacterium]|nr:hypothetical protein [Planctomycetota bacterium]